MIRLDAATVLLQWATGGLACCWFTMRRREVGIGYAWLLYGVYGTMAVASVVAGVAYGSAPVRDGAAAGVAAVTAIALARSIARRAQGPDGHRAEFELVAAAVGVVGLVAAGLDAGGNDAVAVARTVVGAAFLGAVSDAMLLGHWYLVQPGLPRRLLNELVRVLMVVLPIEVVALLLPTGMVSVLRGTVDDGWNGTLGYFWVACVITTAALAVVTRAALRERSYSAVMAATGLLYLAILTSFGTDLVARAVLAK